MRWDRTLQPYQASCCHMLECFSVAGEWQMRVVCISSANATTGGGARHGAVAAVVALGVLSGK
eukprot:1554851-Pleurochrysis_carterae.AAC.1